MTSIPERLWPQPRSCRATAGALELARAFSLRGDAPQALEALLAMLPRFERLGFAPRLSAGTSRADVRTRRASGHARDGYALSIAPDGIEIAWSERSGMWNALQTLAQVLVLSQDQGASVRVPCLAIDDAPDLALRGALLDVSRSRVPTMESVRATVDELSSFKCNQLQLYTEHAFAYPAHERVWRDASPFTTAQVLELDRFCAARGIELVPNQQCFGHMHRWLVHEPYRALAEVPAGVEHAFSRSKEPYGLCASDPASLAFVEELLDALLPCFRAREVNVGLDETFDLGLGRSAAHCAERGKGAVYVDYLRSVHALLAERGRRMQFWGDIVLQHAELLEALPRDAIALEWGYDAGHPFDADARAFAASGLEFVVCPGTSSWQSFAGRTQNLLANVREASAAARTHGARGVLVTDWGDRGHLQQASTKSAGLAAALGLAWNGSTSLDAARLARVLDDHVFADRARVLGAAALELGRANDVSRAASTNGSPLFFLVAFAEGAFPHPRVQSLSRDGLAQARAHVLAQRATLARASPMRADARALVDEWTWTADVLAFACDLGAARLRAAPGTPLGALQEREALAEGLAPLAAEHRRLWSLRDRPGGLEESASWLERPLTLLRGGVVAPL